MAPPHCCGVSEDHLAVATLVVNHHLACPAGQTEALLESLFVDTGGQVVMMTGPLLETNRRGTAAEVEKIRAVVRGAVPFTCST